MSKSVNAITVISLVICAVILIGGVIFLNQDIPPSTQLIEKPFTYEEAK